jgi:D-alanine-D-alanine ligase
MAATRVGVLLGGRSGEREISLVTGGKVAEALRDRGFTVTTYDIHSSALCSLLEAPPDCVFVALHGRWGEDGCIQGLLEVGGIPYVGSGVLASALAMSKVHSKRLFQDAGIPSPEWFVCHDGECADDILERMQPPFVAKPAEEGSALGVSIVRGTDEVGPALELAAGFAGEVMVERFVDGIELTVAVLGNDPPEALPVIEIVPAGEWYDFEAKYTPGMSEHVIPARVPAPQLEEAARLGIAAHEALGCRDMSRVDMIADAAGRLWVLEVNTIPGLTPTSLFPDAARAAGIAFEELCERLVRMALERRGQPGA